MKTVRFFGLAFLFIFSSSVAQAFINIESLRQSLQMGFYGSTGIGLSGASGNVDKFDTGFNTQNIYKDKIQEFLFIADYKYGEASDLKNNHQGQLHLRYARKFNISWSWEIFSQVEFNEFQSLSLRSLAGAGLRWKVFNNEAQSLFYGLGLFYEDEKIQNDVDQTNFRGNMYLSFRTLFSKNSEIVAVLYYQPSAKTVDDYRIQGTFGLESSITESLKIVNQVSYAKDSRPPAGIGPYDLSYSFNFNYEY